MANNNTNINPENVTTGSPVEGACCFTSFAASPSLPTTAVAQLGEDFENLGEISDQGYTKSVNLTSSKFKGWHGTVLLTKVEGEENTFKTEFTEVERPSVAKIRYGVNNVTTDETTGEITAIDPKITPSVTVPLVFDELLSNGRKRRTVFPRATIESIDDEPHQNGSLLVYGMTFSANVDAQNRPYYIREATPTGTGNSTPTGTGN